MAEYPGFLGTQERGVNWHWYIGNVTHNHHYLCMCVVRGGSPYKSYMVKTFYPQWL